MQPITFLAKASPFVTFLSCLLLQALDFSIPLKTSDFVGAKTLSPVSAGKALSTQTRYALLRFVAVSPVGPLFLQNGPQPPSDKCFLPQEEFKTLLTDGGLCPAQNLSLDRHGASFDAAVAGVCHVARLAGQLQSKSKSNVYAFASM